MNSYSLEHLAIVTLAVEADTEAQARDIGWHYQGAEFEATALDVNGPYSADRVELHCVSTRLPANILNAIGPDGESLPFDGRDVVDPELRSILTPGVRQELGDLVAALRAAAMGDSNDVEIDAAIDLADAVEHFLAHSA